MDISPNTLIVGIFISLVGLALLSYGKKELRLPHLIVGLVLVIFPYFVGGVVLALAIAAVLLVGLKVATRLGF